MAKKVIYFTRLIWDNIIFPSWYIDEHGEVHPIPEGVYLKKLVDKKTAPDYSDPFRSS